MKIRIVVGVALSAMLIAVLFFGGYVLLTALSLFSLAAIYEVSLAFRAKARDPIMLPAYIFAAGYSFVFYFFGMFSLVALYTASIMTTLLITLLAKKKSVEDGVASAFLFIYPLMPLMCLMLAYFLFPRPEGLAAACMAFAAPECADTFAYFGGTLLGKHKLCPEISPKKTVEGAVFALIGGVAFGVLVFFWQRLWDASIPLIVMIVIGFLCGVFGQLGDLFASMLKRWAGIKDFSSIFPGHGGIMDRMDSILFCAPLVLCAFVLLGKLGMF